MCDPNIALPWSAILFSTMLETCCSYGAKQNSLALTRNKSLHKQQLVVSSTYPTTPFALPPNVVINTSLPACAVKCRNERNYHGTL
jgi:hypothetical protein